MCLGPSAGIGRQSDLKIRWCITVNVQVVSWITNNVLPSTYMCISLFENLFIFFCNKPGFRGYGLIGKTLILHIFVSGSTPDISNHILNHNIL